MDLEKVRSFARSHLDKNDMMHGWSHTQRVYNLSMKIGKNEEADLEVLKPAALLHDIGIHVDRKNHHEASAELAEEVLGKYEKKDQVLHCIRAHRFSSPPESVTLESEVLQDADNLDAIGAIGLMRTMVHAGYFERPVYDPENEISEDYDGESETSIDHINSKLLNIKDRLHTETAEKIGEKRHEFVEEYKNRFLKEWEGKL